MKARVVDSTELALEAIRDSTFPRIVQGGFSQCRNNPCWSSTPRSKSPFRVIHTERMNCGFGCSARGMSVVAAMQHRPRQDAARIILDESRPMPEYSIPRLSRIASWPLVYNSSRPRRVRTRFRGSRLSKKMPRQPCTAIARNQPSWRDVAFLAIPLHSRRDANARTGERSRFQHSST